MKRRHLKELSLLTAVAALLIAGCGEDTSSGTATLSKDHFLKRANAICKRSVDAQAAGFRAGLAESKASQAGGNNDQEKLGEILTKPIYRAVERMITEVSALGLPEGDEEAAKQVIEEFEVGLKKAEADPATYLTGKAFKKADEAADTYGMNECGV